MLIPVPRPTTNGDEERYPAKSGTYSKGLRQDRAQTYHEKFTVSQTKIDGTTATISNQ